MKKSEGLTPLGVVTLALLLERSMHPYEMYQLLVFRSQDRAVKVRPGTLYHVIGLLEGAGFVEAVGTDRDGNRPERTTYAITESGREKLLARIDTMLAEVHDEYPQIVVAMGEAHFLAADDVVAALRTRAASMEADIASGSQHLESAIARGLPRRYLLGGEFALHRHRADLAFLHSTIADIESGDLSWDERIPPAMKGTS